MYDNNNNNTKRLPNTYGGTEHHLVLRCKKCNILVTDEGAVFRVNSGNYWVLAANRENITVDPKEKINLFKSVEAEKIVRQYKLCCLSCDTEIGYYMPGHEDAEAKRIVEYKLYSESLDYVWTKCPKRYPLNTDRTPRLQKNAYKPVETMLERFIGPLAHHIDEENVEVILKSVFKMAKVMKVCIKCGGPDGDIHTCLD